jgi:hypothetical protein
MRVTVQRLLAAAPLKARLFSLLILLFCSLALVVHCSSTTEQCFSSDDDTKAMSDVISLCCGILTDRQAVSCDVNVYKEEK